MEAVWLLLGVVIGIPLGWVILLVAVLRWAVHACEEDFADHTPGRPEDRKVKGAT